MNNILDALEWRYAVKKFDDKASLTEQQILEVKKVFNLSASSYGLQPYKMIVVQNPELKEKRVKRSGIVELTLWTGRSTPDDLQKIKNILAEYPGKTPVLMHIQSGAGKRVTMELPEKYHATFNVALQRELSPWMG